MMTRHVLSLFGAGLFALLATGPAAEAKPKLDPSFDKILEGKKGIAIAPVKHATAMVEFRYSEQAFWPNFFIGKPAGETFWEPASGSKEGFTIQDGQFAQRWGKQDRRTLGDYIKGEEPAALEVHVTDIQPVTEASKGQNWKGKPSPVLKTGATVELRLGDKSVTFPAQLTAIKVLKNKRPLVELWAIGSFSGSQLGLEDRGSIDVRVGVFAQERAP